ncbi:hypothetical protein ALI144C_02930 [Actinosynnema sp. ALI-1.44]|uniref:hypothetical protein n=1 Tax=Actinosynnema sp. ALI-1.44 TaxID=1933779 RepID=UPI00097C8A55|nr:hypothetical protein [Actinosynnema sp. ALI-1.44]ONI90638.1 hypothetical protein ALI144C_02930 [Actinosynnema sp. ALI-1.44]
MTWTILAKDQFRASYGGEVWLLVSTPSGLKPWLLYTERQVQGRPARQQEIGVREPEAARHAAEFWLRLSASYGLTRY